MNSVSGVHGYVNSRNAGATGGQASRCARPSARTDVRSTSAPATLPTPAKRHRLGAPRSICATDPAAPRVGIARRCRRSRIASHVCPSSSGSAMSARAASCGTKAVAQSIDDNGREEIVGLIAIAQASPQTASPARGTETPPTMNASGRRAGPGRRAKPCEDDRAAARGMRLKESADGGERAEPRAGRPGCREAVHADSPPTSIPGPRSMDSSSIPTSVGTLARGHEQFAAVARASRGW